MATAASAIASRGFFRRAISSRSSSSAPRTPHSPGTTSPTLNAASAPSSTGMPMTRSQPKRCIGPEWRATKPPRCRGAHQHGPRVWTTIFRNHMGKESIGMGSLRRRMLVRVAIGIFAIAIGGGRAFAQDRGGFTALVDLGLGVQNDSAIEETAVGLAGLNFGVGAFLTENLAVMFRISGTNVGYDLGVDYGQVSGVAAPTVQFWQSDKFNVEAGAGLGYWRGDNDDASRGFGLILGAGTQ